MEQWREDVLAHYGVAGMKWGLRKALVNANLFVDPNKSRKEYQERLAKLNEKKTGSSGTKSSGSGTSSQQSNDNYKPSSSSGSRTPQETVKKGKSLLDRLLGAGVVAKVQDSSKNNETTGYYKHGKRKINVKAIANRGY